MKKSMFFSHLNVEMSFISLINIFAFWTEQTFKGKKQTMNRSNHPQIN